MKPFSYTLCQPDQFTTFPFQFTCPPEPPPALVHSVRKAGILTPLLCVERAGELQLVDGHRRLQTVKGLKLPTVPVAVFSPASPRELVMMYLQAQLVSRSLNPVEIAMIIRHGPDRFHLPREEMIHLIASEIPGGVPSHLLTKLPLILDLPETFRRQAVSRAYSATFLIKISELYSTDLLNAVARLMNTLSFSENQLLSLLEWIDDLERKDDISPEELLNLEPIPFLLRHPRMPSAKKRDAILRAIREKRFPHLTQARQAFRELQQKIASVGDIRLIPPKDFMGGRMELRIGFKTPEALRDALETSLKLSDEIRKGFDFF